MDKVVLPVRRCTLKLAGCFVEINKNTWRGRSNSAAGDETGQSWHAKVLHWLSKNRRAAEVY